MLSMICSALVGVVFLFTGVLKALDSASFVRQVQRYRLLPRSLERPASLAFIGIECALGAALVLNISPLILPFAAALLLVFAVLTLWATRTGRVEDCGCYGGQLLLTPAQSIALDGLYLMLLAVAWVTRPVVSAPASVWKIMVISAVLITALVAAARSLREPLADLALLRAGRAWKKNWLKQPARDMASGSHFVVFLSRDCPYCKRWVPLLNVIEVQPELPSVVGVMSLDGEQLHSFLGEHLIRFPISHMPQSLVSMMVNAYPTAALVENGRVVQKWVGEMPKEYVERIQQFFEAVAPPKKPAAGFGG